MADRTVSVKLKADISDYTSSLAKAAAATRGLGSDVEKSMDRDLPPVFQRSGERSGGVLARGISNGLVRNSPLIAAAIGAALAAGAPVALAGAGVLFGGIGALSAAQTSRVREAWTELGHDIRDGAVQEASVLVPVYEEMASKIGAAFQRMRPELRDAFEAAAPQIDRFTDGLTNAAENALPGLVRAVERGGPVIDGLASLMESIGTGLSDFFDAMSDNSDSAGQALGGIGEALGQALPLLGELLGTGSELAAVVLPPLADALGVVADIAESLGPLLPGIVMGFTGLKVAQAAAGWVAGVGTAMSGIIERGQAATGATGRFTGALGGLAVGIGPATAALAIGTTVFAGYSAMQQRAAEQADRLATSIRAGGEEADKVHGAFAKAVSENEIFASALDDVNEALRRQWEAMTPLQQAQSKVAEWTQTLAYRMKDETASADDVAIAQQRLAYWTSLSEDEQRALDLATGGATTAIQKQYGALTEVPGVAESAAGAIAFLGNTANMTEEEVKEAAQAIVDWRGEVATIASSFVEPLTTYQTLLEAKSVSERKAAQSVADNTVASSDSWRDYVDTTKVTLDELAAKLEEQLVNQENWRSNIVGITQRGGLEVGQAFLDMGVEGADLAAQMATATDAEFQRMAELIIRDTQFAGDQAVGSFDASMRVLAAVGSDGARRTAAGIAQQLGIGVQDVARIAAQYGIVLADGVNPLLSALGQRTVALQRRGEGIRNADGNLYEQHQAEIAPGGAWRVWAEPETGGEAYIPLASTKRARSMEIWRETGRRLDAPEARYFAFGGISDVPRPRSTAPYGPPISSAGDATMQKAYDSTLTWMKANAAASPGGGALGGAWGSIWQYVKSRIPQARQNSTYRPGDPGYHGKGKAIDFGYGSGPGGAGSAGLASINRLLHDGVGSSLAELIYDGIGDDRPDLWHGKSHTYSAGTRAEHRNHVHAAVYDQGGPLYPGYTLAYNGTGQTEWVSREVGGGGAGSGGSAVNVNIAGAQIVGTLDLGEGITARIQGEVVSALTGVVNRRNQNPWGS